MRPYLLRHSENVKGTCASGAPSNNEELVGEVLAPYGDSVVIATKFGVRHKNLVPFTCHGGSGFAGTRETLADLQPNADVLAQGGVGVSRDSIQDRGVRSRLRRKTSWRSCNREDQRRKEAP